MSQPITRRLALGAALVAFPVAAVAQSSDLWLNFLGKIPQEAMPGKRTALSDGQIVLGLRDALKVASGRVIGRVGRSDGFNGDPAIRIPLPYILDNITGPLRAIGASGLLDDLQLKMNRAAEQAAPKALDIFVDAASKMTASARMLPWLLSARESSSTKLS